MFARVIIAAVGAIVVTGSLLLVMDSMTLLFENESGERFFRITDILEKPEPGRPIRPLPGARQPDGPESENEELNASVPLELPVPEEAEPLSIPAPEIDPQNISPD